MAILEIATLALRGLQALFAIIVLGLTGHVASTGYSPSQNSFLLFVAIWTLLIVLFLGLAPKFMPSIANVFIMLGLDALTMLFWFAGFIALAVFDRDLHSYINVVDNYYYGVDGKCGNYCDVITAACVFGGFEWVLFAATSALSFMQALKSRRHGGTTTHTAPMTQPEPMA